MNYDVYAIFDRVSGEFGAPMIERNDGTAKRWFKNFCEKSPFRDDLTFYKLGSFDGKTGAIKSKVELLTTYQELLGVTENVAEK